MKKHLIKTISVFCLVSMLFSSACMVNTPPVTEPEPVTESPEESTVPETEENETPEETDTEETESPEETEPVLYDPVTTDMILRDIVPAAFHEAASNANQVQVSYASSIGGVNAYRDGNFYYLFLPQGTPESFGFTLSGDVRSVSRGTYQAGSVSISAPENASYLEAKLGNGHTVYVILMRSSVPCLQVELSGTTLAAIHSNKDVKHPGNTVRLASEDHPEYSISAGNVEIKGRGNSSWNHFVKKGYQIKFEKRTSVLGMEAAKKWILVPNASDGSLLNNKIAYEIANECGLFRYAPEAEFVDLYVSGEYRGLYLITEKVEIDKNRLSLTDKNGVLVELDNLFYGGETFKTSSLTNDHFVLKEAVDETSTAGFDAFCSSMQELENALISRAPWSTVEKLLDTESAAAYYLLAEYMMNTEALYTSFFLYKDGAGDRIHFGPVWDYDTPAVGYGNDPEPNYMLGYLTSRNDHSKILYRLGAYEEFCELIRTLYEAHFKDAIEKTLAKMIGFYYGMKPSADMNTVRYPGLLGVKTWKTNVVPPSFEESFIQLENWLNRRFEVFKPGSFYMSISAGLEKTTATRIIPPNAEDPTEESSSTEEESGSETAETTAAEPPEENGPGLATEETYVHYRINATVQLSDPDHEAKSVNFAIWSEAGGQDDLVWAGGAKTANGWTFSLDLSPHYGEEIIIHAHGVLANGSHYLLSRLLYTPPALPSDEGTLLESREIEWQGETEPAE